MAATKAALIIAFARADGVERLLKSGKKAGVEIFYIAIDGPKTTGHSRIQARIIDIINDYRMNQNLEIRVWQRQENLGVAVSILTAINWFFSHEDQGVILEDDLALSSDFFAFSFSSLDYYRTNEEVWLISGSRMKQEIQGSGLSDWSNYPMIWGWASWSNRWADIYTQLLKENKPALRDILDRRSNYWYIGSERAKKGRIDTWDLPFANAQFCLKKFSVIPPVNLVSNLGFDEHAAHTSGNFYPLNHPASSLPSNWSLSATTDQFNANYYDQSIDRNLYRIQWHHKFLRIYAPLMDSIRPVKYQSNSNLIDRLARVQIPRQQA
jgi:hypothetical protein